MIPSSRFANGTGSKTNEPISDETPSEGPALGHDDSSDSVNDDCSDAKGGCVEIGVGRCRKELGGDR